MIDVNKLSKEQLDVAEKIIAEAERQGVDPNLMLAIGLAESQLKHAQGKNITKSERGALGVMQLDPITAKSLKVNPLDLDENIRGGVALMKQNLNIYGSPLDAAIAYNTTTDTRNKYFKTRDLSILPVATLNYIEQINSLHPLETQFVPKAREFAQQQGERVSEEDDPNRPKYELAEEGAVAGILAGTAEKKLMPGKSKISSISEKIGIEPKAGARLPSDSADPGAWGRKTGHGIGTGSTRAQSERFQTSKAHGRVSKKTEKLYGYDKPLSIEGQLQEAEKAKLERELAERSDRFKRLSGAAKETSKMLGRIPGGSLIMGTLAGKDIGEAIEQEEEGDIPGAIINAIGGVGGALSLIPHPVPRLIGGGLSLATIPAELINDIIRGRIKITGGQSGYEEPPMDYLAP